MWSPRGYSLGIVPIYFFKLCPIFINGVEQILWWKYQYIQIFLVKTTSLYCDFLSSFLLKKKWMQRKIKKLYIFLKLVKPIVLPSSHFNFQSFSKFIVAYFSFLWNICLNKKIEFVEKKHRKFHPDRKCEQLFQNIKKCPQNIKHVRTIFLL